jgi:FAD/FMN-containing dehydrogenase/Fe-S oxidoreductase
MQTEQLPALEVRVKAVLEALRRTSSCQIRDDRLSRAIYATDASIYQIVPDAVVYPRCVRDVQTIVRLCAAHQVPLTARGAGTGLAGGCVNRGIIMDLSRFLNRIIRIDPAKRQAQVEPGVVLDELNARLLPHGLHFSPDVATANRATIGGMIGNNSAGAHSIVVGRTCDHVVSLDVVLADGSLVSWPASAAVAADRSENAFADHCLQTLTTVLHQYADEIAARFPKVFRCNGGYALNRLAFEQKVTNPGQILIGSEGTLGIVVGATLNLLPLPRHKGLVVIHFGDLLGALRAVVPILSHRPAAVELVDKLILDRTRDNPAMRRRRGFLVGDPAAILIVELYDEDPADLKARLETLVDDLRQSQIGYAWPILTDPAQQADVWEVRKAGTGLLMSQPGDTQPYDFIDDCAVDPARLHEYLVRLHEVLATEGVPHAGYYGHASVGLIHVRPALNLKTARGVQQLRRIADRVSQLVCEFEGAMTGEHGDGLVRSEWLERLYGPRLLEAFRTIKSTFDPQGILNPGKIVDAPPMDRNLRYGPDYRAEKVPTVLDFSTWSGMAGLAEMCSGMGECRKRLSGTMCPSYTATGDELHTTRARANALRTALSNHGLLEGLSDPALNRVFDLCLSCKACKTECPTGTDITRLKSEWLYQRHRLRGVPRRSRLIARSVLWAGHLAKIAPLANFLMQSEPLRLLLHYWYGLDRRARLPQFAPQTFRDWFSSHPAPTGPFPLGQVVYFVDTWTNFYQPQVGRAAVAALEALGAAVLVVPNVCCGRPLISQGLLSDARRLARQNVEILGPYAARGIPIVTTEPSCFSALVDELPQLVRTPAARTVASCVQPIESFIVAALALRPVEQQQPMSKPLLLHGHCHQKALVGTADSLRLLSLCTTASVREIDSGCCGMAGAFGHEREHYEIARAIGEQRLFPAIRARADAEIVITGFSCREHIAQHTGVAARHVIELVAQALATAAIPDASQAPAVRRG